MILSIFGAIISGICIFMLLLKRPLREFFIVFIVFSVFGAAEAVGLPMLGGASLTAPNFCVFLVFLRLLFTANSQPRLVGEAIAGNVWLILFALYAVIAGFFFPRLFEGAISVYPLKGLIYPNRALLTFTSQNITQTMYVVLTALMALVGYTTARSPKGDQALINAWIIVGILYVTFAVIDLAGYYGGGRDLMAWARTASYAMLDQAESGLKRIAGPFSEPSSFAGYGVAPLAFLCFLWLTDIRSAITGPLAAGVALMMALSTSTTAFGMLGVSMLVILLGVVMLPLPGRVRQRKFITIAMTVFFAIGALSLVAFMMPDFVDAFADVFEKMTVGKSKSISAIERGAWAVQGFEVFRLSNGLGIGPGSFRSSGLGPAVLGATGAFGAICLTLYVLSVLRTYFRRTPFVDRRVITACATTCVMLLFAAFAIAPSCDPGILFGAMAGFTLGRARQAQLDSEAARQAMNAGAAPIQTRPRRGIPRAARPQQS